MTKRKKDQSELLAGVKGRRKGRSYSAKSLYSEKRITFDWVIAGSETQLLTSEIGVKNTQ